MIVTVSFIFIYLAAAVATGYAVAQHDARRFHSNAFELGYIFCMATLFAPMVWIGTLIKRGSNGY